jgi:hypothetical protein
LISYVCNCLCLRSFPKLNVDIPKHIINLLMGLSCPSLKHVLCTAVSRPAVGVPTRSPCRPCHSRRPRQSKRRVASVLLVARSYTGRHQSAAPAEPSAIATQSVSVSIGRCTSNLVASLELILQVWHDCLLSVIHNETVCTSRGLGCQLLWRIRAVKHTSSNTLVATHANTYMYIQATMTPLKSWMHRHM